MKNKELKGYEAPQLLLETEISDSILCASDLSSGGIGDYTEDDMTGYFN